ncbi:MAG: hypothetical protein JJD98_00240 [Polaromonas sp.]|nr:hypothetical protein [Polaromonas sp.]
MTPTNTCGHCVEHYTHALGWKPCTEPVSTLAEAQAQLAKLDPATHRVYWAFKHD